MAISNDLFMAILAMDAYNRGYNAGINLDPTVLQIGNATIRTDDLPVGSQAASFFAQAYTWNGQTVISYRGTMDIQDESPVRIAPRNAERDRTITAISST